MEVEKQSKQRIDRSNANEFPICSTKYDPRAKLDSISLRHELREVLQKANAVGQSSGEGSGKRYVKNIHTGFRDYCFSQWRGDPLLAKYFADRTVPRQLGAFNYRDFTTIDEEEKIREYLKYRPRPFKAKDIVKDTLDCIGSQVFRSSPILVKP